MLNHKGLAKDHLAHFSARQKTIWVKFSASPVG